MAGGVRPTKLAERVAYTPDRAALQAQQSTVQVAHGVNIMPFASGNLLDREQDVNGKPFGPRNGLLFTGAMSRTLAHGLQRVPNGFMVVDQLSGYATFSRDSTRSDKNFITLASSATANVKIWVW